MSVESLFHPKYMGGLRGAGGYRFEICYILSLLPQWLSGDTTKSFQQELWSDVEIFLASGSRSLVQIKDHPIQAYELREILGAFLRMEQTHAGQYSNFTIASAGLSSSISGLPGKLDRFRNTSHLTENELRPTRNELVQEIDAAGLGTYSDFIIDRVLFQSDINWVRNEEVLKPVFVGQMVAHQGITSETAVDVFYRIANLINAERGKNIEIATLKNEIERMRERHSKESRLTSTNTDTTPEDYYYPRPQFFVGRDLEVKALREAFAENTLINVGGMAGMGKTTLVAHFIQEIGTDDLVLWFDCEVYRSLEQVQTRIAHFLELRFGDATLKHYIEAASIELDRYTKFTVAALNKHSCIVVLDGFSSQINASLFPLLANCSRGLQSGRLIIVSRENLESDNLYNQPYTLALQKLSQDASLKLMQYELSRLHLPDQHDELLLQAFQRFDGHALFLRLVAQQTRHYSLEELLARIPQATSKAYEYIKHEAYSLLPKHARDLLSRVSVIGVPFRISAIESLKGLRSSDRIYDAFSLLLNRYLVSRTSPTSDYYEIHSLVRDYSRLQLSEDELKETHRSIYQYYTLLPNPRYLDLVEGVVHALNADLREEASSLAFNLVNYLQQMGMYNITLELTDKLLSDTRILGRASLHFARGKAFRFKEMFNEAIEEYDKAIDFAEHEEDAEGLRFERVIVGVQLSRENNSFDIQTAKAEYSGFLHSDDLRVRVSTLGILAALQLEEGNAEGIQQLHQALNLAEANKLRRNVSEICYALGYSYLTYLNEPRKAIEYLERSLEEEESLAGGLDAERLHCTYDALMHAYRSTERYDDALNAARATVSIARELELTRKLPVFLRELGKDLCIARRFDIARSVLEEALLINERYGGNIIQKSDVLEWLTVAVWNEQEFEKAFEYLYDYYDACEREAITHQAIHMIAGGGEKSVHETREYAKSTLRGFHWLKLSEEHTLEDVHRWRSDLFKRRPELARYFHGMVWQKEKPSPYRNTRQKTGRNSQCPCGSGKKYKYCCLTKEK